MGAENILPNKGVKVTLAGVEYYAWFSMYSSALLAQKYGSVVKSLEVFGNMSAGSMGVEDYHAIADLISAAFISKYPEFTSDYIEHNFDFDELQQIMPLILEAFLSSMGVKKEKENKKKEKVKN